MPPLKKIFLFALILYVTIALHSKVNSNQTEIKRDPNIKYILQWTPKENCPFYYMLEGNKVFLERDCPYTNCYVTSDRNLLGDVSKFDVIAFSGPEVTYWHIKDLTPEKRSPHQKYAFTSIESADNYPLCSNQLDNFFNWTWTYKLDSDTRWGYIVVRDADKNVIGPNKIMHWMKLQDMDPVSDELSAELKKKTKAVAWLVSNCRTRSRREDFVADLQKELKRNHNLEVDIFGKCGPYKCAECYQMIKRDYHFYLSFENSLSEDYVTEKLLHALHYNAIPIVYGGANYSRFMPDYMYIDARKLGCENLAKKIKHLIDNPNEYKEYFRWKNHYTYHFKKDYPETDDYCGFCILLNNDTMVKKTSIYKNFQEWWNNPDYQCVATSQLPNYFDVGMPSITDSKETSGSVH